MDGARSIGARLILLALFFTTTTWAHSWVEQLMVIAPNGSFVGAPGYPRGNVLRSNPAFSDTALTYLAEDYLCKDTQRTQTQTEGSPRLQASAGAAIALRFQENGHVTLPETQAGKPQNRGTVYVYGTTSPKDDEKLADVHKVWNEAGTGGDGRGVLLAKRDYDDGRCYQVNGGTLSQQRQAEFPHEADQYMGADIWCQSDIAIPASTPSGQPYTIYWVWDWPTAAGVDPNLPNGKQEVYTTCMDVDVVAASADRSRLVVEYDHEQSLNRASMPDQFADIFNSRPEDSEDSEGDTAESSSVPTSSNPVTAAPQSTGVPPVATVTVTSYVTSVVWVRPTGHARRG
ncbi:hypothetical protein ASPCAL08439 [Aspergillus calidoustus]|uniref:DUF7492 domain-containing protein n=1 Tax=Aspergillus calidoustus TaxID=454130 RepID=A0A0U5GRJ3_ASPCI|nr:hypothetical protein ASPCAL08439 [Aspergillus calidoustus]